MKEWWGFRVVSYPATNEVESSSFGCCIECRSPAAVKCSPLSTISQDRAANGAYARSRSETDLVSQSRPWVASRFFSSFSLATIASSVPDWVGWLSWRVLIFCSPGPYTSARSVIGSLAGRRRDEP